MTNSKRLDGCAVLPPQDDVVEEHAHPKKPPENKRNSKQKTGDRFRLLNEFIDFSLRDLSRNELAVWLVLYRDSRDGIARTGQTDIAKRIGRSRRTVIRIVSRLEACGLLQVVHRGSLTQGTSTYRVVPLRPDIA